MVSGENLTKCWDVGKVGQSGTSAAFISFFIGIEVTESVMVSVLSMGSTSPPLRNLLVLHCIESSMDKNCEERQSGNMVAYW